MNHYVNGVSNISMNGGVITFDFISATVNDKGETKIKDEVQVSMNKIAFNSFIKICSDFLDKVKENESKVQIEEKKPKKAKNGK